MEQTKPAQRIVCTAVCHVTQVQFYFLLYDDNFVVEHFRFVDSKYFIITIISPRSDIDHPVAAGLAGQDHPVPAGLAGQAPTHSPPTNSRQ